MGGAKSWHVDLEDAVVRGAIVLHEGKMVWPPPAAAPPNPLPAAKAKSMPVLSPEPPKAPVRHPVRSAAFALVAAVLLGLLGSGAPKEFVSHLTVFVVRGLGGVQGRWNV